MKINLKISIFSIIVSLIVFLGMRAYMWLDEPVFLISYNDYEILYSEHKNDNSEIVSGPLNFYYIDNINSNNKIIKIEFEGYEGINLLENTFSSINNIDRVIKQIGSYEIHEINIHSPKISLRENLKEDLISKAKITFDNGIVQEVDLGKIFLHKNDEVYEAKLEVLKNIQTIHSKEMTLEALTNIKINEIKTSFDMDISNLFTIDIKNSNLENIKKDEVIKNGEYIKIKEIGNENLHILDKYADYNIKTYLDYEDEKGNKYSQQISWFHNDAAYQFKNSFEIIKYLIARGEL